MNGVLQFSVFSEGIVVTTLGYPFLSSQKSSNGFDDFPQSLGGDKHTSLMTV